MFSTLPLMPATSEGLGTSRAEEVPTERVSPGTEEASNKVIDDVDDLFTNTSSSKVMENTDEPGWEKVLLIGMVDDTNGGKAVPTTKRQSE